VKVIRTLLIANRGEIACRILSTCGRLGIRGVVVYSQADADSLAVRLADEAILIGPAPASQSYLNIEAILQAASLGQADAVHPGYGFLAENAELARRVTEAGLIFVGPASEVIEQMGSKVEARQLCAKLGVPTVPGSPALDDEGLLAWADQHGYPVMLKASAGGGGKGMRRLSDRQVLQAAIASARREAEKAFGSAELYLEKALVHPRHLEVQVLGDQFGNHLHLGVRECSLQRRHQKIVEECPPANVPQTLLDSLTGSALKLVQEVGYSSAGTVEFLTSGDKYYFLEMNTRLQVEHPVTEAVTGLDLVELQLAIAEGRRLPISQAQVSVRGHAIEARVTCEDPANGFLPATGPVLHWAPCFRARVDAGIETGSTISPHYDSMVAKVICWGEDRPAALRRLEWSLRNTVLLGVRHNLDFLAALLREPGVASAEQHTELVEALAPHSPAVSLRQLLAVAAARCAVETAAAGGNPLGAFPIDLAFAGQPKVRASGCALTIEGRTYQVEFWPGTLVVDGHRTTVSVAQHDDRWWVHTPEGTCCLTALPRYPVPSSQAAGGSLKAPMPGSIVEVLVKVGQKVEAGQPLLKLEAMKMEHLICAPAQGVIQSLPYAVGDQVEVGVELAVLRTQNDPPIS
jgi:acetyl/propionyl-CoA carboxylase alpha subunit